MGSPVASERTDGRLLIGPALLVLGLVLLKASDVLLVIGPFDRAQFGWLVAVPLLLLAPGSIGVAARWSGSMAARRVAIATGLLLGIVVAVAWFASLTQVGCDREPSLSTRLAASVPIPLILGVGWALAGWLAVDSRNRPVVAVAVGAVTAIAAGAVMLLAWGVLFPGVSCAAGIG